MKNKELFDKTIGILVKAFHGDTLIYTDCKSCAVGNIVACANGAYLKRDKKGVSLFGSNITWDRGIALGSGELLGNVLDINNAFDTGYSLLELAKIEKAFYIGCCEFGKDVVEGYGTYHGSVQENFNGLMHVVDYLMTIHEATTTEIETAKSLFGSTHATKLKRNIIPIMATLVVSAMMTGVIIYIVNEPIGHLHLR